jgi:O-acetylserine/cysteine efflux transporter
VAPLPLLGLSLLIDGPAAVGDGLAHLGWHGVLSTVYTAGLCSLVGYALFNRLLSRYPAAYVVPWVLLAPVVAMASAWALLGEAPGAAELAGAALLVIGVLVAQGIIKRPSPGPEIQIPSPERTRGSADTPSPPPAAGSTPTAPAPAPAVGSAASTG